MDKELSESELGQLLHKAAASGNKKQLKNILSTGIRVDYLTAEGYSPLFTACLEGKETIADCLLQCGADPNQRSKDGSTPVHTAGYSGNISILSKLTEYGGDLRLHDDNGKSVKDWVMLQSNVKKRKKMLEFIEKTRHFAMTYSGRDLLHENPSTGYLSRAASSFTTLFKSKSSHHVLNYSTDSTHSMGYGKVYFGKNILNGTVGFIPVVAENALKHDEYGKTYNNGAIMLMESMHMDFTRVTVKRLHYESVEDKMVDLLIQENENIVKLRHPHILLLMGLCQTNNLDGLMLVFESIALGSLYQYLHQKMEIISAFNIAQIMEQISDAVIYLHSQNFVHCYITSHAVQLVSPRQAKLSNFEYMVDVTLRRSASCGSLDVKSNKFKNAAYNWMSHELLTGVDGISVFIDLYSLCAVMWEMFTGEVPWHMYTSQQIETEVMQKRRRLPIDEKNIPQPFYHLLERGIDTNQFMRRTSVFQVRAVCANYLVEHNFSSVVLSPVAVRAFQNELDDVDETMPTTCTSKEFKEAPSLRDGNFDTEVTPHKSVPNSEKKQETLHISTPKPKDIGKKTRKIAKNKSFGGSGIKGSNTNESSKTEKTAFVRGTHLGITSHEEGQPSLKQETKASSEALNAERIHVILDSRKPNGTTKSPTKKSPSAKNNNNQHNPASRFSFNKKQLGKSLSRFYKSRVSSPKLSPVRFCKNEQNDGVIVSAASPLNASFRSQTSETLDRSLNTSFLELNQYENPSCFKPASHRLSGEGTGSLCNKPSCRLSVDMWSSLPRGYRRPASIQSFSIQGSCESNMNRFSSSGNLTNAKRIYGNTSNVVSCEALDVPDLRVSPREQQNQWFGGASSIRSLIETYQNQIVEHDRKQSILVLNKKNRNEAYNLSQGSGPMHSLENLKHVSTASIRLRPADGLQGTKSNMLTTRLLLKRKMLQQNESASNENPDLFQKNKSKPAEADLSESINEPDETNASIQVQPGSLHTSMMNITFDQNEGTEQFTEPSDVSSQPVLLSDISAKRRIVQNDKSASHTGMFTGATAVPEHTSVTSAYSVLTTVSTDEDPDVHQDSTKDPVTNMDVEEFYFDDVIHPDLSHEKHLCLQQASLPDQVHTCSQPVLHSTVSADSAQRQRRHTKKEIDDQDAMPENLTSLAVEKQQGDVCQSQMKVRTKFEKSKENQELQKDVHQDVEAEFSVKVT